MDDTLYPLHSFKEQFGLEPSIVHKENLGTKKNIVICGMGGSIICGKLITLLYPDLPVTLHNDYGLPKNIDLENTLCIINSYSGNTEEMIDVFQHAQEQGIAIAVLSKGGELITLAQRHAIPHIILPSIGVEPRFAIGHQLVGLLHLMGEVARVSTLREEMAGVDITNTERNGKALSQALSGKYPILYAGEPLNPVIYLIKAAINEGSKVPCFINVMPELNHNEMQGFISNDHTRETGNFAFVMVVSTHDHPRVQKRFDVLSGLYNQEGYTIIRLESDHTSIKKIFELILTGYFAATFLAISRGVDIYKTPFVERFKQQLL